MALRRLLPGASLRAWARRDQAVDALAKLDLANVCSTDLEAVVNEAELVILCTPVETMEALGQAMSGLPLADNAVVTDVGSVKGSVVTAMEQALEGSSVQFVGSHPMAGSEKAGLEAARADLFEGQVCIMTPTLFTTDHALGMVTSLWQRLGCRVMQMSPEEHDRKVARISHMPHLAAAVVALAALKDDPHAAACAGNGFRDTTRVSSGDADLWTGIVKQNQAEVVAALKDARDRFSELVALLENMDEIGLRRFLLEAKTLRDAVPSTV